MTGPLTERQVRNMRGSIVQLATERSAVVGLYVRGKRALAQARAEHERTPTTGTAATIALYMDEVRELAIECRRLKRKIRRIGGDLSRQGHAYEVVTRDELVRRALERTLPPPAEPASPPSPTSEGAC